LGDVEVALQRFQKEVFSWLENSPIPIVRIAFGGVAFIPVANKREGYEALDEFLPNVTLDAEASRDFQYRINRPRLARIEEEDIIINRLTTWSVRRTEIRTGDAVSAPYVQVERASCELDINSTGERVGPLTKQQVMKLSSTLVDFGLELLEQGDVA
jgi:hypothetical protein